MYAIRSYYVAVVAQQEVVESSAMGWRARPPGEVERRLRTPLPRSAGSMEAIQLRLSGDEVAALLRGEELDSAGDSAQRSSVQRNNFV